MNANTQVLPASLLRRAQLAGEHWASEVRDRLLEQQRKAAGGWPGTMSEARLVVRDLVGLGQRRSGTLSRDGREQVARAVYQSAKAWWLKRCDPDDCD